LKSAPDSQFTILQFPIPMQPIYLDHHATTPCDPRVVEAMLPFFTEHFGNPASITHHHGRKASLAVEDARIAIARFLGVLPPEIYFTAGATESNNIALNLVRPGEHLVTSAIEHKSIVVPAERLEKAGVAVTFLAPDREGSSPRTPSLRHCGRRREWSLSRRRTERSDAAADRRDRCGLPREASALPQRHHAGGRKSPGRPLGCRPRIVLGAQGLRAEGYRGLFVRRATRVAPVVVGGGQERVCAPGRSMCGRGRTRGRAAAPRRRDDGGGSAPRRSERRAAGITPGAHSLHFGERPRELRLPGNLNVSFDRIEADSIILAMKRFSLSSGSACSSGSGARRGFSRRSESPMRRDGIDSLRSRKGNTSEHIAMLIDDLERVVRRLREISP